MSSLETSGTLSYNGFVFPVETRTKISSRNIPDKAKRTTKYIQYTFNVTSYVLTDEAMSDSEMEEVRNKLNANGAPFICTGYGLGDIHISNTGPLYDLAYGPAGKVISLIPLGMGNAWQIQWECVFVLPDTCSVTKGFPSGVTDFSYTVDFSQDEKGYLTRTISGEMEIVGFTLPNGKASDSADKGAKFDYWNQILLLFPKVPMCKRRHQRRVSADRRSLNFTITDIQGPDRSFLVGFSDWSGTITVSAPKVMSRKATVTISMEYEVQEPAVPSDGSVDANTEFDFKRLAQDHFTALVASKVRKNDYWAGLQGRKDDLVAQYGSTSQGAAAFRKENGASLLPIPLSYSCTNHMNSNRISFSASYSFTVPSLNSLLRAAGIWIPVPGAGWKLWGSSNAPPFAQGGMSGPRRQNANPTFTARGRLNLFYDPSNDAVIDLSQSPPFKALQQAR